MPGPKSYPDYYAPHRASRAALAKKAAEAKAAEARASNASAAKREAKETEKQPHFLALPLEIRREIYTEVFPPSLDIEIPLPTPIAKALLSTGPGIFGDVRQPPRLQPTNILPLLLTCHQIHAEACAILYSLPLTHTGHSELTHLATDLPAWLYRIGPANRAIVRDLTLRYDIMITKLFDPTSGIIGNMLSSNQLTQLDAPDADEGTPQPAPARLDPGCDEIARSVIRRLLSRVCDEIRDVTTGGCDGLVNLRLVFPGDFLFARMNGGDPAVVVPHSSPFLFDRGLFRDEGVQEVIAGFKGLNRLAVGITCELDVVEAVGRRIGVGRVETWWDEIEAEAYKKRVFGAEVGADGREKMWKEEVARWSAEGWVFGRSGNIFTAARSFATSL